MPNIASVIKDEITRLARKEIKTELASLRKAVASHRTEIAGLKKINRELAAIVGRMAKERAKAAPAAAAAAGPADQATPEGFRYTSRSLSSQRTRLGLTPREVGLLLGASDQSVRLWEAGEGRPRASYFPRIAALRTLSKSGAQEALEQLKANPPVVKHRARRKP